MENVINGADPQNALEQTIVDIYTSRPERWERLAQKMGLDSVPENFQLFRGVSSEFFVEAVVNAWRDNTSSDMQIPAYELSSWSLTRETAGGFARDPNAAVIFEANVPFERTLADKYVDDGSFISSFSHENEVVVAISEKNTLSTEKNKATVKFQGETYTYAERERLILTWDQYKAQPGLPSHSDPVITPTVINK